MGGDKGFVTPGTHGCVFPWTPPPGLAESVCLALVKVLKGKLADTVEELIRSDGRTPQSVQGSPISSADDWADTYAYYSTAYISTLLRE